MNDTLSCLGRLDPVIRSISLVHMQMLLDTYRSMVDFFPFVSLPRDVRCQDLFQSRPMLMFAVLTVSSYDSVPLQRALSLEFRKVVMVRIMKGEKSLDLLQGLLVFIAWHHHYMDVQAVSITMLLQLCLGIAHDLGLDSIGRTVRSPLQKESPRDREAKRAYLGCYYLSSNLGLMEPVKARTMTHTSTLRNYASELASSWENTSDAVLPILTDVCQYMEDVEETFRNQSEQAVVVRTQVKRLSDKWEAHAWARQLGLRCLRAAPGRTKESLSMIAIESRTLLHIGWQAPLQAALQEALQSVDEPNLPPASIQLMRLTSVHRDSLTLHDGHAERPGRALPRLVRQLGSQGQSLAVGDWLLCRQGESPESMTWAHERLRPLEPHRAPRCRRPTAPGGQQCRCGLLRHGAGCGLQSRAGSSATCCWRHLTVQRVVVLTKADEVASNLDMRAAMVADEIEALQARIGGQVPVLAVNGTSPEAALQLAPWLEPGQTVVLLGSSGAGKSTLTNTLLARTVQDTGGVRVHDHRGQHTTTARSLHRLPSGACVIDTPGLRALRPDIDEAALATGFDDIARLAQACRFRDCTHATEPGCAVREAVPTDRLRNYQKLQRELARDSMNALERQRMVATWKARGREGELRARAKRGEGGK